jgi:GGDEF domain-containing protein
VLYAKDRQTPIGFSVITRDLTEQRRAEDRLRLLAMTDPLTGALNRRSFFENAKRERGRLTTAKDSLCVLLLDADFFKTVRHARPRRRRRDAAAHRQRMSRGDSLERFARPVRR